MRNEQWLLLWSYSDETIIIEAPVQQIKGWSILETLESALCTYSSCLIAPPANSGEYLGISNNSLAVNNYPTVSLVTFQLTF